MDKVRVHEVAKELGMKSKEVLEKASSMGFELKSAQSTISTEDAVKLANYVLTGKLEEEPKPKKEQATKKVTPKKPKKSAPKEQEEKPSLAKQEPKTTQSKKPSPKKSEETPPKKVEAKEEETKPIQKEQPIKKEQPKEQVEKKAPKEQQVVQKEIKKPKDTISSQKKEEPKPIKKPESLAQASLKKRRGLVIVKKRRPAKKIEPQEELSTSNISQKLESGNLKKAIPSSLEAMFSAGIKEAKKKKKTKKSGASKKDDSEKLDLLGNRDFSEELYNPEDDMIVLPDLTIKPEPQEPKPSTKKRQSNQLGGRSTKQNFPNQNQGGIQRRGRKKRRKSVDKNSDEAITFVEIPEEIRVYEFAEKLGKQSSEIISKLFMLGVMTTKNDFLDKDSIEILADEFGVEVETVNVQEDFDYVKAYEDEDSDENLELRAPVVTIMGHVDHGKTSLLDYIRNSRVVDKESGGITQHVGAYMVNKNGRNITFIDTPGHEAFTQMRARGAEVTDIVVIVVAADDGVKPQTREAIDHAKAANVPIIIAINKIDKPAANPEMVKTGLSELDIISTDWGGDYEFIPVSAKSGEGIEDLLEIILLQADVLELQANPNRDAKATVIESTLEKGRGAVATVVVENGTLKVGDTVVAGVAYGKIRALLDDTGANLKSIKPGEPGVIVGLSEVPEAGETVVKVKSDKDAREYAKKRYDYLRQRELSKSTKVTLDELSERIAEGEIKSLPVIVKADVQGSLEAIKGSLEKLNNEETKVNIISSGIGGITESDIALANASEHCVILGFHVRPTGSVKEKAKNLGIEIKTYNIIYDLIDDVKGLLGGMMSPIIREEHLGQAEVREVFVVPKIGAIAGCMVSDGSINRGAKVRLIREGVIVYESTISSLKRFKDDVKEVAKGYECGIGIENFNDIKIGDYIESFKEVEEQAVYE